MKKPFTLIIAIVVLSASVASAIVGGPWDGNNFNLTNSGIYQGVVSGKSFMGMFRFSDPGDNADHFQDDVPGSRRTNQGVVFYKGAVYSGTIFGMADFNNKEVNAIFNGDVQQGNDAVPGPGLNAIDDDLNHHDAERSIMWCNFFFKGKMTDDAPIVRFSGQGKANFFGQLDTTETERTTNTTIIEGDTETEIEIILRGVGGEIAVPDPIGEQINIYVYGTQVRRYANVSGN